MMDECSGIHITPQEGRAGKTVGIAHSQIQERGFPRGSGGDSGR